jgi:hypothetical protein
MHFNISTVFLLSASLAAATHAESHQIMQPTKPTPTVSSFFSVPSIPKPVASFAAPTQAVYGVEQELPFAAYANPTTSLGGTVNIQNDCFLHGLSAENVIFTTVAGFSLILLNSL